MSKAPDDETAPIRYLGLPALRFPAPGTCSGLVSQASAAKPGVEPRQGQDRPVRAVMLTPGEMITCENGHLICEVVAPIKAETLNWGRCLGNFRGNEPAAGAKIKTIRCDCGAEWVRSATAEANGVIRLMLGFGLHVEGRGWVPEIAAEWTEGTKT